MLLQLHLGINEIEKDRSVSKNRPIKVQEIHLIQFFSVTELLLVTITDKIASLILFTNCQLFEAISKSKTNVLELNTIK
jgi:hypothetical protein